MKRYKWRQQSEGGTTRYQIYSIPIITLDEGRKVTEDTLQSAVEIFSKDKKQGYLPRVFLGHHSKLVDEEREGVGFLDNLTLLDNTIYADIGGITENGWYQLRTGAYTYVSVELYKNEILGLALLSSSPPYFKFPPICLEEKESDDPSLQLLLCSKFSRKPYMDKKEPEEPKPEEQKETKTTETKDDTETKDMQADKTGASLETIDASLKEVLEILKSHIKWDAPSTTPSSTAYKKEPDKIEKLEREISIMNFERGLEKRGLPKDVVECAVASARKSTDLTSLSAAIDFMMFSFDKEHPANGLIQTFKASDTTIANASKEEQRLIHQAEQIYTDTMNCKTPQVRETFSKVFPDVNTFVQNVLTHSKENPSYLESLTLKE